MSGTKLRIEIDNSLYSLEENPWRQTTEWLEYYLEAKWYAIQAFYGEELAGFMHIIRHPERVGEWFFCDVHVIEKFRKQGVAAAMYEEAFGLLCHYDKAFRITASVKCDNLASQKLHEKMGFRNTGEISQFPELCFEEGETIYEHYFVQEFPVLKDNPSHRRHLERLAGERKDSVLKLVDEDDTDTIVYLFWAGMNAVGYSVFREDKEQELCLLPEWQQHLEGNCLDIRRWGIE